MLRVEPRVEPSDPAAVAEREWEAAEPVEAHPPQPVGGSSGLGSYIWTAVVVQAVLAVCSAWPPESGEPLAVRWLRTCSDHPVRTLLAALLLVRGLRRERRAA